MGQKPVIITFATHNFLEPPLLIVRAIALSVFGSLTFIHNGKF